MLLAIGLLIGLALGLTGAGGSVLAVPLLMLLAGYSQAQAAGLSLAAVGLSAGFGVLLRIGRGQVAWWPALVLAGTGMLLAPVGQWLAHKLPQQWVLVSFALLVVAVALRLWLVARRDPEAAKEVRAARGAKEDRPAAACAMSDSGYFELRWPCVSRLLWVGLLTGLLSGLYGVGGGFIIVPALMLLTGMTIRQAVATSLVIISLVSASGFVSFLWQTELSMTSVLLLVAGACGGMLAGTGLARFVAGAKLQQLLALTLVLLMAVTLFQAFV